MKNVDDEQMVGYDFICNMFAGGAAFLITSGLLLELITWLQRG